MPNILSLTSHLVTIILTLVISTSCNHFASFKDANLSNFTKCCPDGELLTQSKENPNLKCMKHAYNRWEISSPIISNFSKFTIDSSDNLMENANACSDNLNCVDFLRDLEERETSRKLVRLSGKSCKVEVINEYITNNNVLPKCCPKNFSYDPVMHKCIGGEMESSSSYLENHFQIVRVGLSGCPVRDYAIKDFVGGEFTIDEGSKSLKIMADKGKMSSFNYGDYCVDRRQSQQIATSYLVRVCVKSENVCWQKGQRCLWKCCPDGEMYFEDNKNKSARRCLPDFHGGVNLTLLSDDVIQDKHDQNFAIITAKLKGSDSFPQFKYRKGIHFKLLEGGNTEFLIDNSLNYFDSTQMVYCIENTRINDSFIKQSLFLFNLGMDNSSALFKSIILFNSALFALLTILCYSLLPEMQNLHGKCIMMECLFLFLGSAILCVTNVFKMRASLFCMFLAYGIIYAFLGLFAWLNIICVDMWMTFGSFRGLKVKDTKSELRKFLLYCSYGFGIPTIIVCIMLFAVNTQILPESFTPKIGRKQCYFDNYYGADYFTFFIIPMMIMLTINMILFIKTVIYCVKVKNEIEKMRDCGKEKGSRWKHFNADREKMIMFLKLFLIMGILWIFEVISSFISFKQHPVLYFLEIVIDTINSAKGIIIFCIFILKKQVLTSLFTRLGLKPPQRQTTTELASLTMTTTTA